MFGGINGCNLYSQATTRQHHHSSRMHTAPLETVRASVSVATTKTSLWGGGGIRSLNEQLWIGLQWSPPVVTSRGCFVGPRFDVREWEGRPPGLMLGRGRVVPYHVTYPKMHLDRSSGQTNTYENITFPQLRLRTVIMSIQGSHFSGLTKFHDFSMIFLGFSVNFQVFFHYFKSDFQVVLIYIHKLTNLHLNKKLTISIILQINKPSFQPLSNSVSGFRGNF